MDEKKDLRTRRREALYPDYSAELQAYREKGADAEWVGRVLKKHLPNTRRSRELYDRYQNVTLPIFGRRPRFEEEEAGINNKISNDFFSEIVDFKTGYFAGKPIGYSYSVTRESGEETGPGAGVDEEAVEAAGKALTDFTLRNNLFDLDMETTKFASCCGYAARLFYHDPGGAERVMVVPPFEAVILAHTDITEPELALRYYAREQTPGVTLWRAELYDHTAAVRVFEGEDMERLEELPNAGLVNLYGACPLQGIPNNREMLGDAEKVLTLIDAYDRALSDANNDIEAFANAYMVFDNVNISPEQIEKGQKSGAFQYFQGGGTTGKIYFLTKDVNDGFIEHHLDRLESNIYRFSKTPNLHDDSFAGNASGVALKFKLTGLEGKCGMFQAKMMSAGTYMFRLLATAWRRKGLAIDPLQCVMDFHRNFPLDIASEAQAVQALMAAGLPKRVAYAQLSFVDDVEYVMDLIDEEAHGQPPPLDKDAPDGFDTGEGAEKEE